MENTQAIRLGQMPDRSPFDPVKVEGVIEHVLHNQPLDNRFIRVKQFLFQVKDCRRRISVIKSRIMYRRDAMEHSGHSCSDMPRIMGDFSSRIENGAVEIAVLEEKLSEAEANLTRVILLVSDAICQLEDVNQQIVLIKKYIEGKTWECIALEMDNSIRWVQKTHGRALPHIDRILFGDDCNMEYAYEK